MDTLFIRQLLYFLFLVISMGAVTSGLIRVLISKDLSLHDANTYRLFLEAIAFASIATALK